MTEQSKNTSPYDLGNLIVEKKQSHEIVQFIENGKFVACSCGLRHPLNNRAIDFFRNNNSDFSFFEYCDILKKVLLKEDIREILSQIGGLFH